MKRLKKLFLLAVFGLGVCTERLCADQTVDDAIFSVVTEALDKPKIDKKSLIEILKHLKCEIMIIIKDRPELEYQKLYKDLQNVSFDNLISEYWQIMEAINLLPEKSKIYIEEKINTQIRLMPYWRKKALCFLLQIDSPKQLDGIKGN